ncbi:MAG: GNAT family N-acetyltransferase [Eubacterium sp.]|nr:GNAT family N-acetyltransferase [Eubacterium sp.]
MIRLKTITKDNIDAVLNLRVFDEQKKFVSTTAESLAEAYVYKDTAFPFAVYEDDEIVGFIMMGYYEAKEYYTLWKLLIDKNHQNKGYGRKALELGIQFLKEKYNVKAIYTGVSPGNDVAKRLYTSMGFVETGVFENNMEELVYDNNNETTG